MAFRVSSIIFLTLIFSACGGGGGGSNPVTGEVTISGTVTYDFVPHNDNGSLNYDGTQPLPIRGATIEVANADSQILGSSKTDDAGSYSVIVPNNTAIRVRVLAELSQTGTPSWQIRVTDNTQSNALYVMEGSLTNNGEEDSVRNLHAGSGWTGNDYGETRTAAPFAILDSVYQSLQLLLSVDSDITLRDLELRWSTLNRAISGNESQGNIGTSKYDGNIFILGDEDNDTDEYDRAIIQHEFAHYLEDTISRSDSIGGPHSLATRTDMRVAFSEGLANAFTAISSNSGIYQDSTGSAQSGGFRFSLESNNSTNMGWYTENSVGLIIYDVFDDDNDGSDSISLGFAPIYQTLTSPDYYQALARTSIYSFAHVLKANVENANVADIDDLLTSNNIFGTDAFGSGETNSGGSSDTLPIYTQLSVGNTVNVCTDIQGGIYNGYDVRRFLRTTISSNDTYTITAVITSGEGNPDIAIYQNERLVRLLDSRILDEESDTMELSAGEYVLEVYDFTNVTDQALSGRSCFDVSIN